MTVRIDGRSLRLDDVVRVAREGETVEIADEGYASMERSRAVIDDCLRRGDAVYGVNTGFGKFHDVRIGGADLDLLQRHLVLSCCVGVGEPFPVEVVRAMLLLKANALAAGESGVRPLLVEGLLEMLDRGVHPVVPQKGSVGASGDLAPLAHLVAGPHGRRRGRSSRASGWRRARPAGGRHRPGGAARQGRPGALQRHAGDDGASRRWPCTTPDASPTSPTSPERCRPRPCRRSPSPSTSGSTAAARTPGQLACARNLRTLLADSPAVDGATHDRVQDAYALRCMPQVHGASRDAIAYVRGVVETEIDSVTDNPLVYSDEGVVLSGGNFHGQPVALAMDFLGIAAGGARRASPSGASNVWSTPPSAWACPAFLTAGGRSQRRPHGGPVHGGGAGQREQGARASGERRLDPHLANQEDHVSMGTIAARHAREILENVRDGAGRRAAVRLPGHRSSRRRSRSAYRPRLRPGARAGRHASRRSRAARRSCAARRACAQRGAARRSRRLSRLERRRRLAASAVAVNIPCDMWDGRRFSLVPLFHVA